MSRTLESDIGVTLYYTSLYHNITLQHTMIYYARLRLNPHGEGVTLQGGSLEIPASVDPGVGNLSTPNLPSKILPTGTKIRLLEIPGKFPVGLRVPPLKIKILLGSNPPKSGILVRRLAAQGGVWNSCLGGPPRGESQYVCIYIYIHTHTYTIL